jgi:NitT/TauT family transport system permease protein
MPFAFTVISSLNRRMSQTPSPTTAKVQSGRWAGIFRPNFESPGSLFNLLIIVWIGIALLGWFFAPTYIPTPIETIQSFRELITEQGLIPELKVSLKLNAEALALSTFIGLLFSYGSAIPILRPVSIMVGRMRFMTMIGLPFFFTLFLGGGHVLKLALLTFGLTVFFVKAGTDIVTSVPESDLEYQETLRAGSWRVLWESQVRGTLPLMFDNFRQNAAMGWIMLTMVEGIVRSEGGIGAMLNDQNRHHDLAAVVAIQILFLVLGSLQDVAIGWLKTNRLPYLAKN